MAARGQAIANSEFDSRQWRTPRKIPQAGWDTFLGDPTGIFLEHLFDDLFELRDRFKELGMFIEDGEVHLRDLEVKNDQL